MKKKYLYNGQIYTIDQISDAAKSSGKSVNDYLALIKATPVEDSYDYNGKKYTPEQIHEAASASGKSFDEYLSSINVKKKRTNYFGWGSGSQSGTANTPQSASASPLGPKENYVGVTDKSFLDLDIERDFIMSNPIGSKPTDPASPSYLRYLQKKKEYEQRVAAKKYEVTSSPESLSLFTKSRVDALNKEIQNESDNVKGLRLASGYSQGGDSVVTEETKKSEENLLRLKNYKSKLKSSIAQESINLVVPKYVEDGAVYDPIKVGREIISIADPEQDKLLQEVSNIPGIKRAEIEKVGLESAKAYLQSQPESDFVKEKLSVIEQYEKTFDERNFDATAQSAREKIGAAYYRRGNSGFWGHSKESLKEIVNDPNTGLSEAEKKVAIEYIIPVEDKLFFSTDIPGSGFFRSFKNSIDRGADNTMNTILGWTGNRTDEDRAMGILNREVEGSRLRAPGENPSMYAELQMLKAAESGIGLTDEQKKRKLELEKYVDIRTTGSKLLDGIGDLTGQVAQIAFLTKGVGAAGKGLTLFGEGGGLLTGGMTSSALGGALTNETVGLFLTSYLNAYDNYRMQALEMMPGKENAARRDAYAKVMSGVEALSERIFNDVKILNGFTKGVSPGISEIAQRLVNKEITLELAKREAQPLLQKYLKQFGKEYFRSTYQESTEEAVVDLAQGMADSIFGGQPFDLAATGKQALTTFFTTALYSPVVSSMAGAGAIRQQRAQDAYVKYAIVDMARNPSAYIKATEELLLNKSITQEEANEKIKLINTASKNLSEIPKSIEVKKDKMGNVHTFVKTLDYPEMASYLVHRMNESIIADQLKNTTDPVLVQKLEQSAKRSQEIRKGILEDKIGVTPDIREVIADDKKAADLDIVSANQLSSSDLIGTQFEAVRSAEETEEDIVNDSDPVKVNEAKKLLKEFAENDAFGVNTPSEEKEYAEKYPMSFLKAIADQVSGSSLDGVEMNTEKQMVDRYGQAVVDLAVDTFLFSDKTTTAEEDYDGVSDSEQISKERDNAIEEVEVKKQAELKSLYKPDVSMKIEIPEDKLVKSNDRVKNIDEYESIKKDYQSLQDVINCIYG